jgi:hypothetical protein
MLNEHTLDQLRSLRLDGMIRAIEEQATSVASRRNPATRSRHISASWLGAEGRLEGLR